MERVLLAICDGDAAATGAPWWAVQRSRERPLRIELARAVRSDRDRAGATAVLDRLKRAMLASAPQLMITESVVIGEPVRVLRRAARDADLLVLGTGAARGRRLPWQHGPATRLLSDPATATALIPGDWGPAARGPVLAGVAPDGSSRRAVIVAARDAVRADVELQLVHAWTADPVIAPEHRARAAHRRILDEAVEDVHDEVPGALVVPLLEEGDVGDVLADLAQHARIVVLGGRDGARASGSATVARRLLTRTRTPLCVVPAAAG